jgi:hypothetical protein
MHLFKPSSVVGLCECVRAGVRACVRVCALVLVRVRVRAGVRAGVRVCACESVHACVRMHATGACVQPGRRAGACVRAYSCACVRCLYACEGASKACEGVCERAGERVCERASVHARVPVPANCTTKCPTLSFEWTTPFFSSHSHSLSVLQSGAAHARVDPGARAQQQYPARHGATRYQCHHPAKNDQLRSVRDEQMGACHCGRLPNGT